MKPTEILELEKLIIKSHQKNIGKGYDGSYQIGGYIITPIHWGETEDGIIIDEESMIDGFQDVLKHIDTEFAE